MSRPSLLALLVVAALGASCGSDSNTGTLPSSSGSTQSFIDPVFEGTLAVSGSSGQKFTVLRAGTATFMLASLLNNGTPVTTAIGMDLGTWDATNSVCTFTGTPTSTTPALKAQLSASVAVGDSCVFLQDIGNLTGPLTFAVLITHP